MGYNYSRYRQLLYAIAMRVRVLFFGTLKDMMGRTQDSLELPAGACVGDAGAAGAAQLVMASASASSSETAIRTRCLPRLMDCPPLFCT